jgi:hypothetical protein
MAKPELEFFDPDVKIPWRQGEWLWGLSRRLLPR